MTTGSEPEDIKRKFLSVTEKDGPVDLCEVAECVKRNCKSRIPLEKPEGFALRICGHDGTLYKEDEEQLEIWKELYLPERMEMEVIGVIDEFPCEAFGLQLVLLLGEDGRVFAYEDELLHVVAENLTELFQHGMDFPGKETFKFGEFVEDPTEEERIKMMESKEIKDIIKKHTEFRKSLECEFLKTTKEIKERRNRKDDQEVSSAPRHKEFHPTQDTPDFTQVPCL